MDENGNHPRKGRRDVYSTERGQVRQSTLAPCKRQAERQGECSPTSTCEQTAIGQEKLLVLWCSVRDSTELLIHCENVDDKCTMECCCTLNRARNYGTNAHVIFCYFFGTRRSTRCVCITESWTKCLLRHFSILKSSASIILHCSMHKSHWQECQSQVQSSHSVLFLSSKLAEHTANQLVDIQIYLSKQCFQRKHAQQHEHFQLYNKTQ